MRNYALLLLSFILISCHTTVKREDLVKLNGYWEIKTVVQANGDKKDYKINETIDYFETKGTRGYRQKVMPQFDGKFKTNGIQETIKIISKDSHFYIEYSTAYGKWQEQILEVKDSTLVLQNKDNVQYQYKRFTPFSIK